MGTRKVFDIGTGKTTEIPYTPEEEAEVAARAQAKAPIIAQRDADAAATVAAKADATIQYLVTHTPAECYTKVQNDVTNLAQAKDVLGRLAMAVSVLARRQLR